MQHVPPSKESELSLVQPASQIKTISSEVTAWEVKSNRLVCAGGGWGVAVAVSVGGEASAPLQICLIGFDFYNYRVIMAFSVQPCRSERQLLAHKHAVIAESEGLMEGLMQGRGRDGGIGNGLWLSSGYWVFDRTPGGHPSNNNRINGKGMLRMSVQWGAAVAFESLSDASVIVLSTTW